MIAAKNGAEVELVSHRSMADTQAKADSYNKTYGVNIRCVDGSTPELKKAVLQQTEVALCCASAGVRVIELSQMAGSPSLKVVADVNAVPPTGAEGVGVMADGEQIEGTKAYGFGALAIGSHKYQVQNMLFKKMLEGQTHVYLDFLSAFEMARRDIA